MKARFHNSFLAMFAALFVGAVSFPCFSAQLPAELTRFAPPDAQIVTVLELKRLLDSPSLGALTRELLNTEEMRRDAKRMAFFTGSDAREDWEAMMWASTGGAQPRELTVVRGKFDHKRLVEFIHLGEGVTTERYLNIVLHKIPDAETKQVTVAAFLAENLLAVGGEADVRRAIETRWEKTPADEKVSATLEGFAKLPAQSFLRVAIADPLTTPEETAQGKSQVKKLFVSVAATDNAEMLVQADAVNAEVAGQLKASLEALFALAKLLAAGQKLFSVEMMKALNEATFEAQESSVTFKLRVPRAAAKELLNLLNLVPQPSPHAPVITRPFNAAP